MNERRRERLAAFIREKLPEFFKVDCDFLGSSVVSILHVEVVSSGTRANIFLSVFPDETKEDVARRLKLCENKATHFLRGQLGSKYAPAVRFHVR